MGILDPVPIQFDRAGWQDGDVAVWDAGEKRFKRYDLPKHTPSGESNTIQAVLSSGNIANQGAGGFVRLPVSVVPFPCRVAAAEIACFGGTLAADNTNYWEIVLQRYSQSASGLQSIATRLTTVSGGEAMQQYIGWSFDRQAFTNNILGKGDSVLVKFISITASSVAIPGPVTATVRLEEI